MEALTRISWKIKKHLPNVFFEIPGIVYYAKNWVQVDKNEINTIDFSKLKIYVGQTREDDDSLYSNDFYIWLISSLKDLILKNWILNIEICSNVNTFTNPWNENEMTENEQVNYIKKIIDNNFPELKEKIKITKLSDNHKNLLDRFANEWLNIFDKNIDKINLENNIDSLELAKILYIASIENLDFQKRIYWTIPTRLKAVKHKKIRYYSILEIAIRLTDYINWITIQGWERRQEIYDIIIRAIINWDYNHIPAIKKIYDFLKTKQNLWTFDSLHFNKKAFEKELERKEKVKKIRNVIWAVSLSVSLILWWIWTWIHLNKQKQSEDLSNRKKILMSQALEKKSLTQYHWWFWNQEYKTDNQKYERINHLWNKLVKLFIQKYWKGNIMWEELQLFFISKMLENNKYSFDEINYWDKEFAKFIDEILEKPINKATLLSFWFNVDNNYWEYFEYKEDFLNTYKSDIKLELDKREVKKLWEYITKDWDFPDIALYKKDWKGYIVAKNYTNDKYSFEKAKDVSLDFLWTPFNNFSTLLINIWNSLGKDFFHLDKQIIKLLVDKVISWESNVKDIKNWNLIDKINFLYKNFPDKFGFDLKEVLNDTINMPQELVDEIIKDKMNLFFTKVWMYTLDEKNSLEYSVYVYEYKQKRYFILDMWWDNLWESLKIYLNKSRFTDWKEFASRLSKLL